MGLDRGDLAPDKALAWLRILVDEIGKDHRAALFVNGNGVSKAADGRAQRSRKTIRRRKSALRAYRGASRPGSSHIRKAHSIAIR